MNVKKYNVIFELYIKKDIYLKIFKFNNKQSSSATHHIHYLSRTKKYPISIKKIFKKFSNIINKKKWNAKRVEFHKTTIFFIFTLSVYFSLYFPPTFLVYFHFCSPLFA